MSADLHEPGSSLASTSLGKGSFLLIGEIVCLEQNPSVFVGPLDQSSNRLACKDNAPNIVASKRLALGYCNDGAADRMPPRPLALLRRARPEHLFRRVT